MLRKKLVALRSNSPEFNRNGEPSQSYLIVACCLFLEPLRNISF